MRAVQVIVVDVFREQALEMSFVYRNDVIQQVSPTAFDPTLGNAVLPGTFKRGPHRIHLQPTNGYRYLQPILRVSIEDQKPISRLKTKRLLQLLNDPRTHQMPSDDEVRNASTIMADDKEQ